MLLPIGEQTVIGKTLRSLEQEARIEDVYVSTNEAFADSFETYLDNSAYEKPQLSVEETIEESEKLGVVGALAQLVNRENLTDDTLVIAGDNLISFEIADFLDALEANEEATVAAYDVGSFKRASQFGIVELNEDAEIIDFQEKPENPKSTLISIACYGFPSDILPKLNEYLEADNNPDEPGWFIQWLQNRETVHAYTFDKAWFDIGTPDSYLDAVAWHLNGENYVHPSANVSDAEFGENVQVLANATITDDAMVTDSVIFPQTVIAGGEIRRSLVDTNTHIDSLNLSGAVIGAHSRLDGQSNETE